MKDGRYDTSVAILSFVDMQLIKGCFEELQRHLSAKKYEKDQIDAKEAELCEIAQDHFKETEHEYSREVAKVQFVREEKEKYSEVLSALVKEKFGVSKEGPYSSRNDDQMNHVVKNVLFFYPGLFQKRLIVFTTNLRDNHWGECSFPNAGDIVASTDDVSTCRTCFFRYCSRHPRGRTLIPNKMGIIWFLNLAFSYQENQNKTSASNRTGTPNQMKWYSPFGRFFVGDSYEGYREVP